MNLDRRQFMGSAATATLAGLTRPLQSPPVDKNVLIIMSDQHRWDALSTAGHSVLHTPNIDRLASQGMRFTRHYSGAPVCAPARCVLMTGKHLGHAQIRGNLLQCDAWRSRHRHRFPLVLIRISPSCHLNTCQSHYQPFPKCPGKRDLTLLRVGTF